MAKKVYNMNHQGTKTQRFTKKVTWKLISYATSGINTIKNSCSSALFILVYCALLMSEVSCSVEPENQSQEEPSPALSPEKELATFQVEPGFKVQLVASEPMVQDPVVISFDEDGRLWVVEMRGFMSDIDGTTEKEPVGRISVLEDTDGDGQMDVSTIYIDSLIMPRALAIVKGGALIAENESLWLTQDLDGDLQADTKILIDSTYAGSAMPEHSGNGLWRGVDNYYYNAKSRLRYRMVNNTWQRDSTEFRGQWGISHDDEGRLFYNYNWSQLHADLVPPNYLSRNKNHTPTTGIDHGLTIDRRIYPVRPNPSVNRGYIPGTLDEEGRLLEFTAACSPFVFRGTVFPKEFYGNVFVCEPSGNLIKRNVVEEDGLLLTAHDPHPGKEFLASTDERFRPVFLASGPDGALYAADMYRGLIQHGAYVTPYLREQTLSRKLVQPINCGRIWRIVPEDWKATKSTKLSEATSDELIGYLSSSNGWHRDMAQRLLVERNDKSVEQSLTSLALKNDNDLGRVHALWTLQGLELLQPDLLFQLLSDPNTLIRTTALRLLEPIAKENKAVRIKLETQLLASWENAPIKHLLQIALTAELLDTNVSYQLLSGIAGKYSSSALVRDAVVSSLQDRESAFLNNLWKSNQWNVSEPSKEIFLEMITTSIINKSNPAELTLLLSLLDVDKSSFGWKEKSVFNAISIRRNNRTTKPMRLKAAPAILTRKNAGLDQKQIATLSSILEWPGHVAVQTDQKENTLSEKEQQQFTLGRQHYLTNCAGCHGSDGDGLKRFAPTLINSDWVLGDEKRLSLILLHGIEGPINVNGKLYDVPEILPVMPAHSTMSDGAISAILTYIRNEWGNQASAISGRTVATTRHTSQGRVTPWTANELNEHMVKLKENDSK